MRCGKRACKNESQEVVICADTRQSMRDEPQAPLHATVPPRQRNSTTDRDRAGMIAAHPLSCSSLSHSASPAVRVRVSHVAAGRSAVAAAASQRCC